MNTSKTTIGILFFVREDVTDSLLSPLDHALMAERLQNMDARNLVHPGAGGPGR